MPFSLIISLVIELFQLLELTNIETSVECAHQIQTRRIDESHVISTVDSAALHQQAGDPLGFLVELRARQAAGRRAFGS